MKGSRHPAFVFDTDDKRFRMVSRADAENAAIMVCTPWSFPLLLSDNVRGTCSGCGIALQFRPDAPKRPMRLCLGCATLWVRPN